MKSSIVYVRISQDRSGEALGVTRQAEDARKLAEARGWQVLEVVVDNDTSAAGKARRPGFEKVLDALESGRAEVVIAWTLDRLTRNRRDTVRLIEAAQSREATIALVRGSELDMSTPSGRLTADLLAAVARSEIETKSDRQKRANQQARAAGKWLGGPRPFGYEADGVTIREPEAEAIRAGYQMILDGSTLVDVGREWDRRGLRTPAGTRWPGVNIAELLTRARYAGLRSYEGEIVGPAVWPAIVSEDTYHAVVAVLRGRERGGWRQDKLLLTGIATCGKCGRPVWAGHNNGARTYRCRTAGKSGHVTRSQPPVDEFVEAVIVERLARPDARELFAQLAEAEGPDMAALASEADTIRQRLDGIAEAFADGAVTASQLRKATDRLRARLAEIETSMVAVDSTAARVGALVTAADVAGAWALLPRAERHRIIGALVTVTLHPVGRGRRDPGMEKVEIGWKA